MGINLRIVFSHPAPEVTEDEYNAHYDFHLGRILSYAGFLGARRYRLAALSGDTSPAVYEYLSVYEIDGDPTEVLRPLRTDVKAGAVEHPEWFRRLARSSWTCYELDRSPGRWLFDHPYLVLGSAPQGTDPATFADQYGELFRNRLGSDRFVAGGRFALINGVTDDAAPSDASLLAIYSARTSIDPTELIPAADTPAGAGRYVVLEATALDHVRRPGR